MDLQTTLDGTVTFSYIMSQVREISHKRVLFNDLFNIELTDFQSSVLFGNLGISSNPAISIHVNEDEPNTTEPVLTWSISGHGKYCSRAGEYTGRMKDVNGHVQDAHMCNCGRMSCPVCMWRLCEKTAQKAKERIIAGRLVHHPIVGPSEGLLHVIISPPKDLWDEFLTMDGYDAMRTYATRIASEIGLLGGYIVFHPYRQDGVDRDEVDDEYIPDSSNTMNRYNWRWGPHFHVIGYGWTAPSSKEWVGQHHGWIYKGKQVMNEDGVFNAMNYLLSHMGQIENCNKRKQMVTYFGELNSKNLKRYGDIIAKKEVTCSECGKPMDMYIPVPDLEPGRVRMECIGRAYDRIRFGIYGKPDDSPTITERMNKYILAPAEFIRWAEQQADIMVITVSRKTVSRMEDNGYEFKEVRPKKKYRNVWPAGKIFHYSPNGP